MTIDFPTIVYISGVIIFLGANFAFATAFIKGMFDEGIDNFSDFFFAAVLFLGAILIALLWPYEIVALVIVGLIYLAWKVYKRVRRNV